MQIISKTAEDPIRQEALTAQYCEEDIRVLIKDGFFRGRSKGLLLNEVEVMLTEKLRDIKLVELKKVIYRSLMTFASRQYDELRRALGVNLLLLASILAVKEIKKSAVQKTADILGSGLSEFLTDNKLTERKAEEVVENKRREEAYNEAGVNAEEEVPTVNAQPLNMYAEKYYKEYIKPALDRAAEMNALDPDDTEARNSLRNRIEMETRYNDHLEQINALKQSARLVICSVHTDCSKRCLPWQGRVYSLDGTQGVTDDGREYIPLEIATDIYYTTKAGKVYKNGLLGFNCRHYLVKYEKGLTFLPVPRKQAEREYDITLKQRQLEREVRKWRARAIEYKGIDDEAYKKAKRKAEDTYKFYREYSYSHKRAYYPSRVRL